MLLRAVGLHLSIRSLACGFSYFASSSISLLRLLVQSWGLFDVSRRRPSSISPLLRLDEVALRVCVSELAVVSVGCCSVSNSRRNGVYEDEEERRRRRRRSRRSCLSDESSRGPTRRRIEKDRRRRRTLLAFRAAVVGPPALGVNNKEERVNWPSNEEDEEEAWSPHRRRTASWGDSGRRADRWNGATLRRLATRSQP